MGWMETDTIGGFELTVPTQATVMRLAFSAWVAQPTSTTGVGARRVLGLMEVWDMAVSF
jgi:hypothetical protein